MTIKKRHIAVDLDGTMAKSHKPGEFIWDQIGEPVPEMIQRIRKWLTDGHDVSIYTARVAEPRDAKLVTPIIEAYCKEHVGVILPVTATKWPDFDEFWDDRAVTVERDTGKQLAPSTRGLGDDACDVCQGSGLMDHGTRTYVCRNCHRRGYVETATVPPDMRAAFVRHLNDGRLDAALRMVTDHNLFAHVVHGDAARDDVNVDYDTDEEEVEPDPRSVSAKLFGKPLAESEDEGFTTHSAEPPVFGAGFDFASAVRAQAEEDLREDLRDPENPKDTIGSTKLPLSLWPFSATAYGCLAMLEGALKYGRSNWRAAGVKASIYVDACARHLVAWYEGEDCAPDSEMDHLAHALACLAIILDARTVGKLVDDRNYNGANVVELLRTLTPHVARLKAKYADKHPHHYTIADHA